MSSDKKLVCKSCGGTEFITATTDTSGDVSCANCGWVAEVSALVSELQFNEVSGGGVRLNGQNVRLDQTGSSNSLKSRDITLMNARRKIRALAGALNISDSTADAAVNWFSLALQNNFVKGRKSQNVIAACLYISCRKERTHHMLVDFSSKLQTSVYSIGSTFLKLVKCLNITSLPLTDPSLFIQHFADRLSFGNKKIKVIRDATKLAHKMSQDWIHEGRRPAGIAGACVLLAARMNNFRRTHNEIIALAHVGEETIQRRLIEFKQTQASNLSIQEFRNTENSQIASSLPPVFQKHTTNAIKSRSIKKSKEEMNQMEFEKGKSSLIERFIEGEITMKGIDSELKRLEKTLKNESRQRNLRKLGKQNLAENDDALSEKEKSQTEELDNNEPDKTQDVEEEQVEYIDADGVIYEGEEAEIQLKKLKQVEKQDEQEENVKDGEDGEESEKEAKSTIDEEIGGEDEETKESATISRNKLKDYLRNRITTRELSKRINGKQKQKQNEKESAVMNDELDSEEEYEEPDNPEDEDYVEPVRYSKRCAIDFDDEDAERREAEEETEADNLLSNMNYENSSEDQILSMIERNRPRNLCKSLPTTNELLVKISDSATLSDIDDDEIQENLLSKEAAKVKEEIFVNLNGDFLLQQEQKRLKQEADELAGHSTKPVRKRRKRENNNELSEASKAGISLGTFGNFVGDHDNKLLNKVTDEIAGIEADDVKNATSMSVKTMLRSRQASTKLNYNAIDTIFNSFTQE